MSFAATSVAQEQDPIVEDFETGDFSLFEWQNDSVYPWVIDTLNPYDGFYCMKSSNAGQPNTTSAIQVSVEIPEDCIMSFYSMVSAKWDDIGNFYIDGELKSSYMNYPEPCSWGKRVFDVTAGTHVFKWEYEKNESGDFLDDCFYVDSITFYRHLELPLHGWHTYCGSDFYNALGDLGVGNYRIATCYPAEMLARYEGTKITKVAVFSDSLYNAVYGTYTCSIWFGGETPQTGTIMSSTTFDVPAGLNEWVEFDLCTPSYITGNTTVWVVYEIDRLSASSWPLGMCNGFDSSGNGDWHWTGNEWEHLNPGYHNGYGDWTVKTYFEWDEQPAPTHDIYYAGNGDGMGKVWKNDMLIQSISDTALVNLSALQIVSDGSIYTAGYSHDSLYNHTQGHIWMNDSVVFDAGQNTAINKLELYGNQWTAAGIGENEWENVAGLVWQDGEILYAYSDSISDNLLNALAFDTITGDIYAGGSTAELDGRAIVWKNDTILWMADTTSTINAIAFDGTNLYAAGSVTYGEQTLATLWQNDSIIFSVSDEDAEFNAIALYEGSVYLGGYSGNSLYIWQNDEVLYDHAYTSPSNIYALEVNEYGVYYAGQIDSIATVWQDGEVLYQPEGCDYVTALSVLPTPPVPDYTITLESANPEMGTVDGGGTYPSGSTVTIVAIPELGCEFLGWNDSITDNPREIVVTQDSTFVASFGLIEYTITVVSDHPAWGSVTGGGTYHYGDTVQIEATPYLGFEFVRWQDSNTDNPRTIVVTQNRTYTATFRVQQCLIKTEVTPEGAGTVSGGGTYDYGTTIHLTAHSNTGYVFSMWEDGNITNPRSVFVEGNATYTAVFSPLPYEITTECDPVEGGTVSGAGTYYYGSTATLTATPNENYIFLCWSDGIATNPRYVTVTGNANYKAMFYLQGTPQYTITVLANDPELGTVSGGGTYPEGTTIEISATPAANARFTGWDDGNTDNPRSVTITGNMTFTALFEAIPPVETYTITVRADNPLLGTVYGSGTYLANTVITIGAAPASGYYFSGWQDGNMDNPRTITVTGDAEYIAFFSENPVVTYTVTVYYDETQGFVLGAGTYNAGATATLAAIPADDYTFVKWSDGTTDNPKVIVVNQDITLAAFFNFNDVEENGEDAVSLFPNPADDVIRLEGLEGENDIEIFNAMGVMVKRMSLNGDGEINIEDLAAGQYIIRIGGHSMRFVKE